MDEEKKYSFTIERPVLCWKYETIVIDANSEEEALEMCKNEDEWDASDITDEWDVERYEKPEIISVREIIPPPPHHACPRCGSQPGVDSAKTGYIVRCYSPQCPNHPVFFNKSAAKAFEAWDSYWADYDKMNAQE